MCSEVLGTETIDQKHDAVVSARQREPVALAANCRERACQHPREPTVVSRDDG